MRTLFVATILTGGLGAILATAQPGNAPPTNNEAEVRNAVAAYGTALKTGDLKAIMACWAADAEFTDADGNVSRGHDAISKLFVDNLAELKAGKSVLSIKTLRFLTPDVVAMDGFIEFTPAVGATESDKFSSVWTRKDGRWLISSARDLPEVNAELGDRAVKSLQWIFGEWTAEDRGTKVQLTVKPELDGKFAMMRYELKGPKESMTVMQLVGWDPLDGAIKSWTFDSRGGYGEGTWDRQAAIWTNSALGVLPTGQLGSSVNSIRVLDPNTFVWQSAQREVEGQPIPDHEMKFTRVTAK